MPGVVVVPFHLSPYLTVVVIVDVQKPKSVVAAAAIRDMNADVHIEAYQLKGKRTLNCRRNDLRYVQFYHSIGDSSTTSQVNLLVYSY